MTLGNGRSDGAGTPAKHCVATDRKRGIYTPNYSVNLPVAGLRALAFTLRRKSAGSTHQIRRFSDSLWALLVLTWRLVNGPSLVVANKRIPEAGGHGHRGNSAADKSLFAPGGSWQKSFHPMSDAHFRDFKWSNLRWPSNC